MGKNLIQQARGKGGPRYKSPSFKFRGDARIQNFTQKTDATIMDIIDCPGHTAPLLIAQTQQREQILMIAPNEIRIGEQISINGGEIKAGNTLALKEIPEGTAIYNIESQPGDGGKFCRTSGTSAKILTKTGKQITIILPSKKERTFNENCRATIGTVAGSGRTEKPILKAGKKHHMMSARNKRYPIIGGSSQNAVDHPFGNKRSARKAKQKPVGHFAPPGRKVGKLWPKRTGRKK